jgi:hypothetical protein
MISLADLHRIIEVTLASHRLGRPVFVRYHWYGPEHADAVLCRLAQLTAVVRAWLDSDLDRLHAVANPDRSHVSLTLQFHGGATALIGFAHARPAEARVDLMILGQRGALYQEDGNLLLPEERPEPLPESPDQTLLHRIERALKSEKFA